MPKEIPANDRRLLAPDSLGLVLSGGGSRGAYQVGALKALAKVLTNERDQIRVIVGSSVGGVNGIILGGCLRLGFSEAVSYLDSIWRERTFRNTFRGSPSRAFVRALQVALVRYSSPGPVATSVAVFDPTPLRDRIDDVLNEITGTDRGGTYLSDSVHAVGVMATIEGKARRPVVFACSRAAISDEDMRGTSFSISYVERLSAAHALASAALPSVLPPVKLSVADETVKIVDGGISDNFPVDPAVRLGANRIINIDTSGRRWWFDQYKEPHDTRPTWEVPAQDDTFCMMPMGGFEIVNNSGLGSVLKATAGRSTKDFIAALGPVWPIFRILKRKLGEDLAYEVLSYVALHPYYFEALLELGFKETEEKLKAGLGKLLAQPYHPAETNAE